jgi:hypothetical protein
MVAYIDIADRIIDEFFRRQQTILTKNNKDEIEEFFAEIGS